MKQKLCACAKDACPAAAVLAGIVLNGWSGCWWADLLAILAIVHCGARKICQAFKHARFKIVAAIPLTAGPHPAIAGKPSGAADGAVQAAPPLLLAAEHDTVLTAKKDGQGDVTPPALQDALRMPDSRFELRRGDPAGRRASTDLLEEAQTFGADLLVTDAYTHRRLMELVLGGVTRNLLANVPLPMLMQH